MSSRNTNKAINEYKPERKLLKILDLLDTEVKEPSEEPLIEPIIDDTPSPTEAQIEETSSPTEAQIEETSSPTQTPVEESSAPTKSPIEEIVTSSPTEAREVTDAPVESTSAPTEPEPVEEPADATADPNEAPIDESDTPIETEPPIEETLSPTDGGTMGATLLGTGSGTTTSSGGIGFGISSTFTGSETGAPDFNFTFTEPEIDLDVLVLGGEEIYRSIRKIAKEYRALTDGQVNVNVIKTTADNIATIRSDGKRDVSQYDLYVMNPIQAGASSLLNNFMVLDDVIDDEGFWDDVFPGYKTMVTYKDNLMMVPLEGDVLSLYYRSDIFDYFGLSVPKTWDEYTDVAAAIHGENYNGTTLVGSCVTRRKGCKGFLWTNLLLSSMTQYQGTESGFLYDPYTMQPLTGGALEAAIDDLEGQVLHGASDEFLRCDSATSDTIIEWMTEGSCALTYNWGGLFKAQTGSPVEGLISTAPTPGSLYVLDRSTNELARCTEEICGTYGYYDDDLGWINQAPYAAAGGWAGAIPKNTNIDNLEDIVEFVKFASDNSEKASDATRILHDPYRESQMNANSYQGIPQEEAQKYLDSVQSSLGSKNVVLDVRFSEAKEIMQTYEAEITAHLEGVRNAGVLSSHVERLAVVDRVDSALRDLIEFHDSYSDVNAATKYQESLNLMPGNGAPSFGAPSAGFRNDISLVSGFAMLCLVLFSLR